MQLLEVTLILGMSAIAWTAPTSSEATPHPVPTYDQSQQGENNVHLSLNNLNFLAQINGGFKGDFSSVSVPWTQDYEYNYDYPDYPSETDELNSTTTISPNSTVSTNPPVISVAKQPCPHGMKRNGKGKCIRRPHQFRFPFGFRFGPRTRENNIEK